MVPLKCLAWPALGLGGEGGGSDRRPPVSQELQHILQETSGPTGKHKLARPGPEPGPTLLAQVDLQSWTRKRPGEPEVKLVSRGDWGPREN